MTHACYLLRSLNPRFRTCFYIGCTTDPRRRLRQHNGELGHGANLTKSKRPWEMVLCVYGFSSHVNALKFEWAWQHPFESLTVREAAAKLPSLKGIPGMITLVCTMVTLPRWNSLNLTLQFMLSNLLQHRNGSPPLPHQMRLFVAPVQSLPGKASQDHNIKLDNLATCPEVLSQSESWDDDGRMNAITSTVHEQVVISEVSLTAELYTSQDRMMSPCVKSKGKKSRKGKTPQGRKGKRGGTDKLSEDPILLELQKMGKDTRLTFITKEIRESDNCSVLSDSRMTTAETTCRSTGSHGEMIDLNGPAVDLSCLSIEERILLFRGFRDGSLEDESDILGAFSMKTAANQTACTSCDNPDKRRIDSDQLSEKDLSCRSIGEWSLPYWASNDRLHSPEKNVHIPCSGRSALQVGDLPCKSPGVRFLSDGSSLEQSQKSVVISSMEMKGDSGVITSRYRYSPEKNDHLLCGASSMQVRDLPCQSTGVRFLSDGDSLEQSQKSVVLSSMEMKRDSGVITLRSSTNDVKAANQESDSGDSDVEEINLEDFQPVERRRNECAESFTQREVRHACCILSSDSLRDKNQTRERDRNPIEEKGVTGIGPQQKSSTNLFPARKKASVPTSIYRRARNGEMYKVLEDHSNVQTVPTKMKKSECTLQDLKSIGESIRETTLVIDSDDDEILEISVNEFQQSTLLGKSQAIKMNGKVFSFSNFR